MESIKVIRKLFQLAEVLVESTEYSKYCHTLYEASAKIERFEKELAAAKAQKPVRWLVERDTAYESDEYFRSEKEAFANAALGMATTYVIPLYLLPTDGEK